MPLFRACFILFIALRHKLFINPQANNIKHAAKALGPVFIKFGQLLSTRPDMIPPKIQKALCSLQDNVPAFPSATAKTIIEKSLDLPIDQLFSFFDPSPLAAASIAQVHSAILPDGSAVVVKILRPNAKKQIKKDIRLLLFIARCLHFFKIFKRYRLVDLVHEFKMTLHHELNFKHEAANASQLKRHFAGSTLLYIPQIYWPYTRANILVMERIHGIPISDINALKAANINLKKLAERGIEVFFAQVFGNRFFHADMHPGNIFVCPKSPENPQYIAVDFGIMGTLTAQDQNYLAKNFLAFFNKDYHQVAKLHIQSGWVDPKTRIIDLETEIRTVCEPLFEQPLKDISFGLALLHLFQTAQRFNMTIQPQLFLLQKTLVNVEGLGKQLYPDLNLWESSRPHLEKWIKKQHSPPHLFKNLKKQIPIWLNQLLALEI